MDLIRILFLCFIASARATPPGCITILEGARQMVLAADSVAAETGRLIFQAINPRTGEWLDGPQAFYSVAQKKYVVDGSVGLGVAPYGIIETDAGQKGCLGKQVTALFGDPQGQRSQFVQPALAQDAVASGVHTLCVPRQGKLVGGSPVSLGPSTGLLECAAKAIQKYPTGLAGVMRYPWAKAPKSFESECWAFLGLPEFVPEVDFRLDSSCLFTDLNLMPGRMAADNPTSLGTAADQVACRQKAQAKYPNRIVGFEWNSKTKFCSASDHYLGVQLSHEGWYTAVAYPPPPKPVTTTTTLHTSTGARTTTTPPANDGSTKTALYVGLGVGVPVGVVVVVGLAILAFRKRSSAGDEGPGAWDIAENQGPANNMHMYY